MNASCEYNIVSFQAFHLACKNVILIILHLQALLQYYKRIANQVDVLESVISEYGSKPVPMNELISWFSFDSMGDFGFGQSFEMLKTRKWLDAIMYMQASWALLGVFNSAIWIPRLTFDLAPFLAKDWFKALKFADNLLEARMEVSIPIKHAVKLILLRRIYQRFSEGRTADRPGLCTYRRLQTTLER